jgi:diguanylate cyclase (GGDEF)-like protein
LRPLTISAGIACCPEHGVSRDSLVKAADDALYIAKQSGRNRVLFFSQEGESAEEPGVLG